LSEDLDGEDGKGHSREVTVLEEVTLERFEVKELDFLEMKRGRLEVFGSVGIRVGDSEGNFIKGDESSDFGN